MLFAEQKIINSFTHLLVVAVVSPFGFLIAQTPFFVWDIV